jgi:hypothetical protein
MRTAKAIAVLAVAALAIGAFTAVALAGNKKKTTVVFFNTSPKFNSTGKVTAKGTLNSTSVCKAGRGVKLQQLDATGAVDRRARWVDVRPERKLEAPGPAAEGAAGRFELRAGQGDEGDGGQVRLQGGRLSVGAGSRDLAGQAT